MKPIVPMKRSQVMKRRIHIGLAVIASWLIAVCVLVTTLQFLAVTPGYEPDHIE